MSPVQTMLAAFSTVKKYNFHGFEALPAFCTDVPLWNPAGTHGIGCSSTNYSALEKSGKIGSFITCWDIMLPHSGNRSHASTKGARSGKTPCKINWKLLESATIFFFFLGSVLFLRILFYHVLWFYKVLQSFMWQVTQRSGCALHGLS